VLWIIRSTLFLLSSVNARYPPTNGSYALAILTAVCQYIDMVCIYCSKDTKVVNSRLRIKDNEIWRRRKCTGCGVVFSSTEKIDLFSSIKIIKRSGKLQDFSEPKIIVSIYRSIDHLPNAPSLAGHLTKTALQKILYKNIEPRTLGQKIDSTHIEACVFSVLQKFDSAGAIKYRAYKNNLSAPRDIRRTLKAK
jgi:transcriptional regulator NrdR family protein